MRVLWLRPSVGDNISVRRERIAAHLREKGFEVTIRDASGTDAFGAIREAVTGDYDVIAGNVRMGLYIGYPLSRILRIPAIGDVSDPMRDIEDEVPTPVYRLLEWYEWQVLSRTEAAVFVYESSYEEALERGIDAYRLPNVVEWELFEDPPEETIERARATLEETGVSLDRPIAVYIGGFSHTYHILDILEAARTTPDWEFLFIGQGVSGTLEREVRAAADSLENVHWPGAYPYELVPGFLKHCSAGFCFKNDEQPLKLKEYGAAGLPTIVQPGRLEKWWDQDELVFTEPTSAGIQRALAELEDPAVAQSYVENFRASVDDRSWDDIAAVYEQIFREIA